MGGSWGVLEKILASKRGEIARGGPGLSGTKKYKPGGLVFQTLRRLPGQPLRLIAEIKPRSPSAGQLSTVMTVAERACAYAEAGASMISVLVDGPFFGGSYENLKLARKTLDAIYGARRPRLLCKEFILDAGQLDWARETGADAVLLIARIVSAEKLDELVNEANMRDLEALVEVTTAEELRMAEMTNAKIIGVNARDLNTLEMNHERAAEVLSHIDGVRVRVHLSGLVLPDGIARITRGGADAALVGEALMREDDPRELLREMVGRAGEQP